MYFLSQIIRPLSYILTIAARREDLITAEVQPKCGGDHEQEDWGRVGSEEEARHQMIRAEGLT